MIEHPVGLIIARGGSRRLPRKNVLPFCGKPLVEWSIIQMRCSRCLADADIYLSTDDDEIAGIGARNGINIIRRPDWPDADRMAANPVYMHALDVIEAQRPATHVYTMLPTQVVRNPWDLWNVTQVYLTNVAAGYDCHSVQILTQQRETLLYKQRGVLARPLMIDKNYNYLGQGPSAEVHEVSWVRNIYGCMRYDGEERTTPVGRKFMMRWIYWAPGKWYQAFDIDDQDSFELCELLFERYVLQGRGDAVYWEYLHHGGDGDGRVGGSGEALAEGRRGG